MNLKAIGGLVAMILLLGGCCGSDQGTASKRAEPEAPVLGYLDTKDYRITITSGSQAPLYTVRDAHGAVLARDLSQLELSMRFPELQQVVETGMADLDASLTPSPLEMLH